MTRPHASLRTLAATALLFLGLAGQSSAQTAPPAAVAVQVPFTIGADPKVRRRVGLKEALELTARQSPEIALARAQAAVAQAGVRRAYTAWQPDVSAGATFDHTSAPAFLDFGQIALGLAPVFGIPVTPGLIDRAAGIPKTTIVAENSLYAQAQISQPLFTPQGLFLPGIAETYAAAAARGADEAREQILLATAKAYLGLQGTVALLKAAQDSEQVSLRREDDARAQIKAGTAVDLALLRAQAETAAARVQIAAIEGAREGVFPLLEGLTGEAVEPVEPTGKSELPDRTPVAEPWEQSFAVQAAILQVKALEKTVSYDTMQWLPSVAAIAKGNYNSNGGFANTNTTYDLILAANIPLYDRGARYAARNEDQARLAQALASLAAARVRARSAWVGARANLSAADAALQQALAQSALAAKVQAQVDASAKAGLATSLDMIDADTRKFAAASNVVQARVTVETRRAELLVIEGKLHASLVAEEK